MLVSAAPHLLCLQECSLRTPGTINALRAEARDLGYVVHASLQHNMVVLARRGLNFVPVESLAGDEEYRMQRFAFKIGSSRILLRHRHAPSDGPCQRRALNQLLNDEPTGELLIDIGDFNELPAVGEGLVRAFPTENTYRHNSQTDDFVSCIDGAVVSHTLGLLPVVSFPGTNERTQHKPVALTLGLTPDFHNAFRWRVPKPVEMGQWEQSSVDAFDAAVASHDADSAWAQWVLASGATRPDIQSTTPWGGFSVGPHMRRVEMLFKRFRKLSATGSAAADDDANNVLMDIASIIDDQGLKRLKEWKAKVLTRRGAAQYVRNRMARRTPDALPPMSNALYTPNDIAWQSAGELAERWNTGLHKFRREHEPTVCFADGSQPCVERITPDPPLREQQPIDLSLFDGAPPPPCLEPWTAELVLEFLPSGSAGLDGMSAEWLQALHHDSLSRLVILLNLADAGYIPTFWRAARVTMIPKEGADASDRRPITVLAVTYRLWAKRKANCLNRWLSQWRPFGLSGAMADVGVGDVLWDVTGDIDDARCGRRGPLFLLSLDQRKCFDRLFLESLESVCSHLGLGLEPVLQNYRCLSRLLFVDGQPTEVWLQGSNQCGIPQGCPLATFLCNLTALAWHVSCQRSVHSSQGQFFTCLDDRLATVRSWAIMQRIYDLTIILDRSLGPDLNVGKCYRGVAAAKRYLRAAAEPTLVRS